MKKIIFSTLIPLLLGLFSLSITGCDNPDSNSTKRAIPSGVPENTVALINQLSEWNAEQRAKAAIALGIDKDKPLAAVPFLIDMLGDYVSVEWSHYQGDLEIKIKTTPSDEAIKALNIIDPYWTNSSDAKAASEKFIANLKRGNASWLVRKNSVKVLGTTRNPKAVEPLIPLFEDKAEVLAIRRQAAIALVDIGDKIALDSFAKVIRVEGDEMQDFIVEQFIRFGSASVDLLTKLLKDGDANLRAKAARALGEIRDRSAIPSLIMALKDKDEDVIRRLTNSIAGFGKAAIEPLHLVLKHNNSSIRKHSARVLLMLDAKPKGEEDKITFYIASQNWNKLVKIGAPTIPHLLRMLDDEDIKVRKAAAKTVRRVGWHPGNRTERVTLLFAAQNWEELAKMGKNALDPLVVHLDDKTSKVRVNVIETLGRIGHEAAIKPLKLALEDKHSHIRKEVVIALYRIGGKEVLKIIISALEDESSEVRSAAIESLGKMKDPIAIDALIEAMKDKDEVLKVSALDSLETLGALAIDPLITALENKDWSIRNSAVILLGKLDDPKIIQHLVKRLKDEDWVIRKEAAETLKRKSWEAVDQAEYITYLIANLEWDVLVGIGRPSVEPLIAILQEKGKGVKKSVIWALVRIKDRRAVLPLTFLLEDKEPDTRKDAADALGYFGDSRAVEPLIRLTRDKNLYVEKAAIEALKQIAGDDFVKDVLKNKEEAM
ncbi:HEAT repeat domain-containing protein [Thermodesulfobacteriota bacterium]